MERRDAWHRGRERWPGVELAFERYAAHADRHDAEHLEDLYLACACAEGSAEAVTAFEIEVLPEVRGPVGGLDGDPAFIDEVLQRTRTKLLVADEGKRPRIDAYAGKGRLAAWVTVSAIRTGLSLLGQRNREARANDEAWAEALALPPAGDVELEYLKQRHREEIVASIRQACAGLSDRDRTVMRMHFVDGLNIQEIAQIYASHRATVARWIAAARDAIAERTHALLIDRLDVSETELGRLNRLVRSQLDVSLSQLFATP